MGFIEDENTGCDIVGVGLMIRPPLKVYYFRDRALSSLAVARPGVRELHKWTTLHRHVVSDIGIGTVTRAIR